MKMSKKEFERQQQEFLKKLKNAGYKNPRILEPGETPRNVTIIDKELYIVK